MRKRTQVKQNYLNLRKQWRAKHGLFSIEKLKGEQNEDTLQDAANLLIALGAFRQSHLQGVHNRAYQRFRYYRNHERAKEYQRNWKRLKRKRLMH